MTKLTNSACGMSRPLKKITNNRDSQLFRKLLPQALANKIEGRGDKIKGRGLSITFTLLQVASPEFLFTGVLGQNKGSCHG